MSGVSWFLEQSTGRGGTSSEPLCRQATVRGSVSDLAPLAFVEQALDFVADQQRQGVLNGGSFLVEFYLVDEPRQELGGVWHRAFG